MFSNLFKSKEHKVTDEIIDSAQKHYIAMREDFLGTEKSHYAILGQGLMELGHLLSERFSMPLDDALIGLDLSRDQLLTARSDIMRSFAHYERLSDSPVSGVQEMGIRSLLAAKVVFQIYSLRLASLTTNYRENDIQILRGSYARVMTDAVQALQDSE